MKSKDARARRGGSLQCALHRGKELYSCARSKAPKINEEKMTRQKRPKVRGFNPGSGQKRKHFITREWRAISARQLERRSGALPVTLLQSCDLIRSQELALLRRVQHSPLTDQVPSPSIFTISSTFGLGSDLVRMSAGMSEVRRCTTSIRPLATSSRSQ